MFSASHDQLQHVGFVPATPYGRDTISILRFCLPTIFLFTFTILHVNLPPLKITGVQIFLKKLTWVALGILVPEWICLKTFYELYLTRAMVQIFKQVLNVFISTRQAHFLRRWGMHVRWASKGWRLHPDRLYRGSTFAIFKPYYNQAIDRLSDALCRSREALSRSIHTSLPTDDEIKDMIGLDSVGRVITCIPATWFAITVVGRLGSNVGI